MDIELRYIAADRRADETLVWRGVVHLDGRPLCIATGDGDAPVRPLWMSGFGPADLTAIDETLAPATMWDECRAQATSHVLRGALAETLAGRVMFRSSQDALLTIDLDDGEDAEALIDALLLEDPGASVLNRMDPDEAVAEWLRG